MEVALQPLVYLEDLEGTQKGMQRHSLQLYDSVLIVYDRRVR
jgi:hypothetical protein